MLRFALPVFGFQNPVLQKNRKGPSHGITHSDHTGISDVNGRQPSESLFWPEIFGKFPVPALETVFRWTAHTTIIVIAPSLASRR
jgi:hypothetical protein